MSDTPRMDSVAGYARGIVDAEIIAEGDRLERELNAANESFRKLNIHTLNLVDRIRRLEEAGDALKAAGYFGGWADAVNKWIKVRDAKP